ncbi:MAG: hypothetical protein AAGK14_09685 [Verrucomicrobiota bacterium]
MRFPLRSPGPGQLALRPRIFGAPQLLLDGQPLPRREGGYQVPAADGESRRAELLYRRDPFIPAVRLNGEIQEVVPHSPLALALSILPLVLGAALGANLGDRLGTFPVLVLGVLTGATVGYFFQKAVYYVLRGPNPAFARVLITVGLYFALLLTAVFVTAILALLFPDRMAG